MGTSDFGQAKKTAAAGGFGEGTQCLGESVGAKTLNRFFCIKHTKMVIIRVNKW